MHEPVSALYLGAAATDAPLLCFPINGVPAALGFPSPAEDFQEGGIDLNQHLVCHPAATFFYRAQGWSMVQAGICSGDVLIVDRSVTPKDGDIVIASWDGNAPVCKVLKVLAHGRGLALESCNPDVAPIVLGSDCEVEVFAVVGVVRQMQRGQNKQAALHWGAYAGTDRR